MVEVRGDPHGVFRPREGGLTRIRCFRVVSCRVVVVVVVVVGPQKYNNKKRIRLFSNSYERTRRAVRCKRIVRTRRVFFVKMSNLTKSTFYGPGPTGPIWAHGPWPKMGPFFIYFLFCGGLFSDILV